MEIPEKFRKMSRDKKMMASVVVLCIAGLVLIMVSPLFSGGNRSSPAEPPVSFTEMSGEGYCTEIQQRLEEFLGSIEGAGEVRVFLKAGGEQRYVYATEGKKSISDNRTEAEEKYVMIGGTGGRSALVETVKAPEIEGAVVLCSGYDLPSVREQLYRAASAALGISTSKIYVAKLDY